MSCACTIFLLMGMPSHIFLSEAWPREVHADPCSFWVHNVSCRPYGRLDTLLDLGLDPLPSGANVEVLDRSPPSPVFQNPKPPQHHWLVHVTPWVSLTAVETPFFMATLVACTPLLRYYNSGSSTPLLRKLSTIGPTPFSAANWKNYPFQLTHPGFPKNSKNLDECWPKCLGGDEIPLPGIFTDLLLGFKCSI